MESEKIKLRNQYILVAIVMGVLVECIIGVYIGLLNF